MIFILSRVEVEFIKERAPDWLWYDVYALLLPVAFISRFFSVEVEFLKNIPPLLKFRGSVFAMYTSESSKINLAPEFREICEFSIWTFAFWKGVCEDM